jgi:hypothetical protein
LVKLRVSMTATRALSRSVGIFNMQLATIACHYRVTIADGIADGRQPPPYDAAGANI